MVRVFLKGGVWKNSEDEVLKAAIQKYGKQQWARVASLLNRKTAKQAKARWYEWLDPSIRKTEWSRPEEEKLLHLAKLLPAQWKTIAPLVGRTATQCQEHYEHLLDQAASSSGGTQDDNEDMRKQAALRPGQIDSHPETKPARPDPIDMDEDELEMLQEARARLANTQGKKAKRKQREKILAQAKRLADLQKRRELKQAGLLSQAAKKRNKNRREIDLGVEIPFHKPAPVGFHDTSSEQLKTQAIRSKRVKQVDFQKINQDRYRSRDYEEAQRQKREASRLKILEQTTEKYGKLQKEQEEQPLVRPRGILKLPEPTITDEELAQAAKQNALDPMVESLGGSAATQALLGDYTDRPLPTPMRTPATGALQQRDLVREASKLRMLERQQTPLLNHTGPDRDDEEDEDDQRKPSALAATPRFDRGSAGGQTPARRDELGLNDPGIVDDGASVGASTFASHSIRDLAREERRAAKRARLEIEKALAALPAPQYEYELAVPVDAVDMDIDEEKKVETVKDQADLEAAERGRLRDEAEKRYQSRSSVLKRNDLPRPTTWKSSISPIPENDEASVMIMIQEELETLAKHDAYTYPIMALSNSDEGSEHKSKKKRKRQVVEEMTSIPIPDKPLDALPEEVLESARAWITEETVTLLDEKVASVLESGKAFDRDAALDYLATENTRSSQQGANDLVYTKTRGWVGNPNSSDILESLELEFNTLQQATETLKKTNDKLEAKLAVVNGGYQKRSIKLNEEILSTFADVQNARIEQSVYDMLKTQEQQGGQDRVDRLEQDIARLRKSEAELQKQYGDLILKKRRMAVQKQANSVHPNK